jgi:hypothetical protein
MTSPNIARTALASLAAFVLLTSAAHPQSASPASLTGTWRFNVTTDAGAGTPTVVFKQQGDSLSGSYSSQVFGENQIRGSVKDRAFNFAFTANVQGTTLNVTYRGTIVSADSLIGDLSLGELGSGTFTAKRQSTGGTGSTFSDRPRRENPSSTPRTD